ncbi:MAG: diacylglycerol kinase [Thermodesulfovibrionales bacterium]|jgi:diacylglycerol kinase (ATP)
MPIKRWVKSANNAIEGILHAARSERHIRYHFYTTVIVLTGSILLGINRSDFAIIVIAVVLVILAEMVNSAIEYIVDLVSPQYSEEARIIKDVAAGAVLITAVGAAVLGYITLAPYVKDVAERGFVLTRPYPDEIILLSLLTVVITVIMIKSLFGKGHPLRGGMPSGHAAIAFSAWVSITCVTGSVIASLISLVMAILVARSRVAGHIHTLLEVCLGSLLGAGITLILFAVFQ